MKERARVVFVVARDPGLARVELAYLGFNMAECATWVAILVWAYALGGAAATGLMSTIQLVPSGLIAPFAAIAGDRFRRDRVLLAGYLAQAGTAIATGVAMLLNVPAPVTVALATLTAISYVLTRPTQAALLPGITRSPEALTAANAVSGLVENGGLFLGPAIAGVILGVSGPGAVFAAFGGLSLVSALVVARLPVDRDAVRPTGSDGSSEEASRTGGALGGFRVLRSERPTLIVVLILSAVIMVIGALDVLTVAVAVDLLGADESYVGFLYSMSGLGGIVGALAAVSLVGRRRLAPPLAGGGAVFGLPIAAMAAVPAAAPALVATSGAAYGVTTVAGYTLIQRTTPDTVLARVFGVLEAVNMFGLAVGALVSAFVVETFGIPAGLVVVGLAVPVIVGLAWRTLRTIDREAKAPDPEALALLRALPIFAPLPAPAIERIVSQLVRLEIPAGADLIRQGDEGDRFYVIAEGTADVTRDGVHVAERGPGEHVGEIALLRDVPRTATVAARTPMRVLALDRAPFLEAVTGHPQSRARADEVVAERS